jgi:hypothetical protein
MILKEDELLVALQRNAVLHIDWNLTEWPRWFFVLYTIYNGKKEAPESGADLTEADINALMEGAIELVVKRTGMPSNLFRVSEMSKVSKMGPGRIEVIRID